MGDVLGAAARLHSRAIDAQNTERPRTALRLLARARLLLESELTPEAQAQLAAVWITIALNEAEINGVQSGLAALAEARRRAEQAGDDAILVRVHNQAGLIASRGGLMSDALAEFTAAHELIHAAGDHDRFSILLNLGTAQMLLGDTTKARTQLSRAADFAKQRSMSVGELKAVHNLGYLEFVQGDLPRALHLMDRSSSLASGTTLGGVVLDRSRVLIESGLVWAADHALLEAEAVFRRERLAQDLGETELERARCALLIGDTNAARRLAGRARDRFRRRGNDQFRRVAELVLLQGDLAAGRPGKRLVGPAERVASEFAEMGLRLPAMTAGLIAAEAHLSSGQIEAAAKALAAAGRPSARDPITARLHYVHVQAKIDLRRGRRVAAVRRARAGLDELARYQASFGSIDLSTAAAVHGRHLADLDLSIALQSRRPRDVFVAAEHARAVAHRLPVVRPPDDPRAASLIAELRQTVESMREVERDAVATRPLARRRAELEREISLLSWSRAGSGSTVAAAGLDDVRSRLRRQDTVMIMLVQAHGALHALVIDGERLDLRPLGEATPVVEHVRRVRADLDVLAQQHLPRVLRDAVHNSFAHSTAWLDEVLVRPLGLGDRRIVLVSTGVFGQLPWGLLPSLRSVPIVVAPSATAWLTARGRTHGRRARVVALAGPDLERSDHEVKGVAQAWDAEMLVGPAADRQAFIAAMSNAAIVHIAAHGVHQTENPLFSSLRISGGNVFAHELDTTKRTPEHVVLSACELGLATVRPGDEALGLTSVLLHLGTRSVVAGVARVGDDVAAETMTNYHRALAAGADSPTALSTALASNDPDHPAPFVCFGAAWSR